jgi:hypothetical protein
MQVQFQNDNDWLREEQLREEQERQQAEQRRLQEEARKKAEEEAERMRIEQEEAAEKKRQEEERKKAEAEETAKKLHEELAELVSTAEELVKALGEKSKEMETEKNDDEVLRNCDELDAEIKDAKNAVKMCSEFISLKHLGLVGASEETRQKTTKVRSSVQEAGRTVEREAGKVNLRRRKAVSNKEAEARRIAAVKAAEKQESMFKQYDVDADGKLDASEIMEFVKGEYDFEFPLEKAEGLLKQDAFAGLGGVTYAKFPHLKMLIGIARNEAMAKKRKLEKEAKDKADAEEAARRKKLAIAQTAQVLEGIKVVETAMSGIEAEVAKAEQKAKPLGITRGRAALNADRIHEVADEVEVAVEAGRDFLAAAKDQASSMAGVPNDKLEPSVIPGCAPARQLFFRLDYMEKRLAAAAKAAQTARDRVILAQKKAQLMREAQEAAVLARQQAPPVQQAPLVMTTPSISIPGIRPGMPLTAMPNMQTASTSPADTPMAGTHGIASASPALES